MGNIEERRLAMHSVLEEILGSKNVYFQPPGSTVTRMSYPCFRYKEDRGRQVFANNKTYIYSQGYQLMYIDPNPIDSIKEELFKRFSNISYDRQYIADNMNHDVYTIFV